MSMKPKYILNNLSNLDIVHHFTLKTPTGVLNENFRFFLFLHQEVSAQKQEYDVILYMGGVI